jgi:aspartyl-tRNA(Asn)/glutamyl-tRNA(Gln) amidotransferase subunit C
MVKISQDDVVHLAQLARIDLRPDEVARLTNDLSVINESIAKVQEVATADVVPTSHPIEMGNVFRADIPATIETGSDVSTDNPFAGDLLEHNAALSGGPQIEDGQFVTPKILGED